MVGGLTEIFLSLTEIFVAHGGFVVLTECTEPEVLSLGEKFTEVFLSPTDFLTRLLLCSAIRVNSIALAYRNNCTDCSDSFFFFFDSLSCCARIALRMTRIFTRCARFVFVECALSPLRGFGLGVSLPGVDTPVCILSSLRDLVTRFARFFLLATLVRTLEPSVPTIPCSLFPTPCSLHPAPYTLLLKKMVSLWQRVDFWHRFWREL